MIMQQWNAATTTRHSYTLTYQFLTDLQTFRVALRYSIDVTRSGRGKPKNFDCTSRASG